MTRKSLNKTLSRIYLLIGLILLVAFGAKLARHLPDLIPSWGLSILSDIYEVLKDMSLVLITAAAAYLANVFQKRSMFVESLRQEWRAIVKTKTALITFCDKAFPTTEDYLQAYARLSESLDNMRIVYRNVGETDKLIGLYPYAPLHDMRRALMTLDPRDGNKIPSEQRALVRDSIQQSFSALREKFLDELDLEEPTVPQTAAVGRRLKSSGATRQAIKRDSAEQKRYERTTSARPDIDQFLSDLYYREKAAQHAQAQLARAPGEQVRS